MIYNKNKNFTNYDIKDYDIKQGNLNDLINQMSNTGGFESVNLTNGITTLKKMIAEPNCTKFLSFVGTIISTSLRRIIKDMIKKYV